MRLEKLAMRLVGQAVCSPIGQIEASLFLALRTLLTASIQRL
jgi:hypothetical protein